MTQEKLHGIVMEVNKKQYIILTDEGDFKKIKRTNEYVPQIGEKITVSTLDVPTKKQRIIYMPRIVALIAIIFLIVTAVTFFTARPTEASYAIMLKINPSVEVVVDSNLDVLEVHPLNQEAEQLLQTIGKDYTTLYDFSHQFIQQSIVSGFLNKNGNIASSIVSLNEKEIAFEQHLQDELASQVETESVQANIEIKELSKDAYDALKENVEQVNGWQKNGKEKKPKENPSTSKKTENNKAKEKDKHNSIDKKQKQNKDNPSNQRAIDKKDKNNKLNKNKPDQSKKSAKPNKEKRKNQEN
ncbi:Anti-sigma-I factor RsgI [Paraliobacillus sp. PM-2]|uniref:anti-sigma factor domain-containing protein n=1 Tax=Paraliobacillus sp. PM-2 TaxID=1462524 RepID=UPI00061CD196|nr:anti-sigma factor domain-containing protein [Paraliobacillus sp. PM-2]CQR45855.1 Anti-sigma-I factor RsgI [Paraliobacillus sp. PM-2]